jgi:bacterioferritin
MKGFPEVIECLNSGLTVELTAVNQYFIHSKMCESWGLHKLAKHYYDESIEEMKHAEEVIDRILYLDGTPEIGRYGVINSGSSPEEQISFNLNMESNGVSIYNEAIQVCIDKKDSGSRELMERMVVESEESVDWAEAQLDLIKRVGLENYLTNQIGEQKE